MYKLTALTQLTEFWTRGRKAAQNNFIGRNGQNV
jgi:hypothetical protein